MRRRLPANHRNTSPKRQRGVASNRSLALAACTRRGFTLVELLIVIFILAILALLAIPVLNAVNKDDKITGGSRSIRSFLAGARDRALHSKLPRGVRFLRDNNDPNVITGMVYIGPAGKLSQGTITIAAADKRTLAPVPPVWGRLQQRGLIEDGALLKIGDNFYTIVRVGANWRLTKNFIGPTGVGVQYELELGADVLPNQEPRRLLGNVVIDLRESLRLGGVPRSWARRNTNMDVLFSPRGTIVGPTASFGHIHLVVTSLVDFDAGKRAGDPSKEDLELIVSITTQTGAVSAHSVFSMADPFRNAESGVETE